VRYAVRVTDREDGTLRSGRIRRGGVAVSAQYLNGWGRTRASPVGAGGRQLIEAGDWPLVPSLNRKSLGPTYRDVALKYPDRYDGDGAAQQEDSRRRSGVWGPVAMPAHPALSDAQAAAMVAYIMSLADSGAAAAPSLPVRRTYTPPRLR